MLQWLGQSTQAERRTFWACLSGWSLDSLDVNMFSLVIPALVASWHVSHTEAGLIGSITLVGSALGGWLGGALADRIESIQNRGGMITPRLSSPCGHRWRAGSRGGDGGRRLRACRSARPCARRGRAARWFGSSASAASCSYAWPRSR